MDKEDAQPGSRQAAADRGRSAAGRVGRQDRNGAGLGAHRRRHRQAARDGAARSRPAGAQSQQESPRNRRRHRIGPRPRSRCGRDRARPERNAARRRRHRRGLGVRQDSRAHRRQGQTGQESRPVDSGRDHGALRRSGGRRHAHGRLRRTRRARSGCETHHQTARRPHRGVVRSARLARNVHGDAGRRRRKDAQPHPQGRRPRFGRGAALARGIALDGRGRHPRHPRGRRRDHAQRRQPRLGFERGADRLQHPSGRVGQTA